MNRVEGYQILQTLLKNPNLIKHCFAAEASMRGICVYLNPTASMDEIEKWGLVGLLHDADYELTADQPERHGIETAEKIPNLDPEVVHAIQAHNYEYTKIMPKTQMDWAIASCDQLTGLIAAATLVSPDKKLASVTPNFILNRFYDKSFAKGANRKSILPCEEKLGIPLIKFIEIVLSSMRSISQNLGL